MELRYQEITSAYAAMKFKRLTDEDQEILLPFWKDNLQKLGWLLGDWVSFKGAQHTF